MTLHVLPLRNVELAIISKNEHDQKNKWSNQSYKQVYICVRKLQKKRKVNPNQFIIYSQLYGGENH